MAQRVVIVIPTYNEAENIGLIVPAIHEVDPAADILVVDDNSPDGTGKIVEGMAAADPRVHLLSRRGKEGLGRAYVAGFGWCLEHGYDVIVQMDCDFSHQPRYLPSLLAALQDADVVIGSRYVKGGETESWPLKRKILSMGGNLYARTILGMKVIDLSGSFRLRSTASYPSWYGFEHREQALLDSLARGRPARCRCGPSPPTWRTGRWCWANTSSASPAR